MTDVDELRSIAAAIDEIENEHESITVDDVALGDRVGDVAEAAVTIHVPIGFERDGSTDESRPETDAADNVQEADRDDTPTDGDDGTEPDEEAETVSCDVEDCDYSGTKRGLAIHKSRAHADGDLEAPTPDEIKALRERHGWTQADLAEELEVGESTVANWETAYCKPSGDAIEQLDSLIGPGCDPEPNTDSIDDTEDGEDLVSETDGGAVAADITDTDREEPPHLPDALAVADVKAIVEDETYLSDVAEELELSVGETRALLVHTDCYSDIREGQFR